MVNSFEKYKGENGGGVFLEAQIETLDDYSDAGTDISYKLLYQHIHKDLLKFQNNGSIFIISKNMSEYLSDLFKNCSSILNDRSLIVRGLFCLYQTARALERYNKNILNLSNQVFRSKILFPNLVYLLQQYLPETRKFLQTVIRTVYNEVERKSESLVNLYVNSFYLDKDVIKHNVLLEFLGNGLKNYNPLNVGNINAYYKAIFRKIFDYYFRKEQSLHTVCTNFWNIDNALENSNVSTRLAIYKDVLYNLQVDEFYKNSPLYTQLGYNYRIFRNIIINNEIQDVYVSISSSKAIGLNNNEYKLLKIYNDDLLNNDIISKIRKLPTIFKLLKCVHIITSTSKSKAYNDILIKPELLKLAVREELLTPFKNFFSEHYLLPIIDRVADNFVNSILSGEYINLLTLSTVRIDQISFAEQLRKFVRLCLEDFSDAVKGEAT
ncbi:MAG TPA: hypothetical protein PLL26_06230 [Candidatus Dojkabacteria bacterium]|nr:hypothetical protein [Candidatus Dojkabacteria bacterium]